MPFFVVVGGHCRPDKPFLKSIECFDPRVGRCDKVGAVLKEGMIEASAAESAGKICIAGGYNENNTELRTVKMFELYLSFCEFN